MLALTLWKFSFVASSMVIHHVQVNESNNEEGTTKWINEKITKNTKSQKWSAINFTLRSIALSKRSSPVISKIRWLKICDVQNIFLPTRVHRPTVGGIEKKWVLIPHHLWIRKILFFLSRISKLERICGCFSMAIHKTPKQYGRWKQNYSIENFRNGAETVMSQHQ